LCTSNRLDIKIYNNIYERREEKKWREEEEEKKTSKYGLFGAIFEV
jgi:hypothetical protein